MSDDFLWRLKTWYPDLPHKTHSRLVAFRDELVKWNNKMSLISDTSIYEMDRAHFADSIEAARVFNSFEPQGKVFDIGSGNGFPAVILCILFPQYEVVCVESDSRKASFLLNCSIKFALSLNVKNLRVEDMPQDSISLGLCRAFAPLKDALNMANACFVRSGRFYHMKAARFEAEIEAAADGCSTWNTVKVGEYQLPGQQESMRVLLQSAKL